MRQAIAEEGNLARFRPYPAYKESGVEWLGKVPEHWSARRLKYIASQPIKNGIGEAGAYDNPEWPRYVRITDIAGPRTLRGDTFKSLPPTLAKEAPLKIGDVLLAAVGATFGKSYLHSKDIGEACFAGYLVRFSPGSQVDPGFVAYWTESAAYWALVESRVVQATIQNFSAARYRDLGVPLPGLTEQRAITAFLDRETAEIDALVAKKERLIELLQEKRTALITQAVTRGLDSNVPMKDSGVEWLGEIPEHWQVERIRHVVRGIEQGWSPECENREAEEEEWGVLKAGCVNRGLFIESEHKALPSNLSPIAALEIAPGDLLMSRASGSRELVGSVAVVPGCRPRLLLCDKLFRLHVNAERTERRFLALAMNSRIARWQIEIALSGGSGLANNIAQQVVKDLIVALPPPQEQRAISAFLDAETATINALVAKVRAAIDRIKELRTALISAAVTGKIDVREVPAP